MLHKKHTNFVSLVSMTYQKYVSYPKDNYVFSLYLRSIDKNISKKNNKLLDTL